MSASEATGIAGVVFVVPEIEVGAVLVEDELVEGRRWAWESGSRGVVASGRWRASCRWTMWWASSMFGVE